MQRSRKLSLLDAKKKFYYISDLRTVLSATNAVLCLIISAPVGIKRWVASRSDILVDLCLEYGENQLVMDTDAKTNASIIHVQ